MKTLTVKQLIDHLMELPIEYLDAPVYLASDSEGNNFGTVAKQYSLVINSTDKNVSIHPERCYLAPEAVHPLLMAQIKKELEEEDADRRDTGTLPAPQTP